jgi:hypothetical protein
VIPKAIPSQADEEIPFLPQQQEQPQILLCMKQLPRDLLQHEKRLKLHLEQPLPQELQPITYRQQDQRVLELQQHLQHQQASYEQIILLKEQLHEAETSQLKAQIKELRDQLENRNRPRYLPYQQPINQQRYEPQHQSYNFNTAQLQTQPPRSYDEQQLYEVIELVYGVTENVWTMF